MSERVKGILESERGWAVALAVGLFIVVAIAFVSWVHGIAPGLTASIAVRVTAAMLAFALVVRFREWRVLFLAAMLLLMAARQSLTLFMRIEQQTVGTGIEFTEIPGFVVSILALASIVYLGGALARYEKRMEADAETIRDLRELLPICASCKKIRLDGEPAISPDSWVPVDHYMAKRAHMQFSHGLCPCCVAELYPSINLHDDS